MKFNEHSNLKGEHAFMSPSSYAWSNYDTNKLIEVYENLKAKEKGTEDHKFAEECITRKQRIYKGSNPNLANYINDAVSLKMTPEVVLYYSPYCFGTADAISFANNELRIHDLKTGKTPAKFSQLEIYAALFCLEYQINPKDIYIELRIYQYGEVYIYNPDIERIEYLMNVIRELNYNLEKHIERMKEYA